MNLAKINKTALVVILMASAFVLQSAEFLKINGIVPNLPLISFVFFSFTMRRRRNASIFWFAIFAAAAFAFWWQSFWLRQILLLTTLATAIYFLTPLLGTNDIVEAPAIIFVSTLLFYLILNFPSLNLPWFNILGESVYNTALGGIIFLMLRNTRIL